MSTMEAQAPDVAADELAAAVDAQMGKIMTELGAALGVLLTSLGVRSGLWAALAGAGPLTIAEVAAGSRWSRRWSGSGCARRQPAVTSTMTPTRRRSRCPRMCGAIHYGPGGALVDAAASMMSSMGAVSGVQ